jgi:hypothetical protein
VILLFSLVPVCFCMSFTVRVLQIEFFIIESHLLLAKLTQSACCGITHLHYCSRSSFGKIHDSNLRRIASTSKVGAA